MTFPLHPDWRVFAYLAAVALMSAVLSGLAPAFQALDLHISQSLKGRQGSFGDARYRAGSRAILISVQVGLSLILLAGAGLFLGAYQRVINVNPGLDTRQVLALTLQWHRPPASWSIFHHAFADRIKRLPGILEVAYAACRPFELRSIVVRAPGRRWINVQSNAVSPTYFATLGIQIVHGRSLEASDSATTDGIVNAVVSERLVREMWGGESALGRTLQTPAGDVLEVVGIARDTAVTKIGDADEPIIYQPLNRDSGSLSPVVRFTGDLNTVSLAIRSAVLRDFPDAAIDVRTVQSFMDERTVGIGKLTKLVVALGIGALVLAIIGIYGVVSFDAKQRAKEIGLRLAFGAKASDVFRIMLVRGLAPVATGIGVGLLVAVPACVAIQRTLDASFIDPGDPLAYAAVSILLVVAALAAIGGPALRASSSDPMAVLREE